MIRYINKHNERFSEYDVGCVLKLSSTSLCVRSITLKPKSSLECAFNSSKNFILRIKQNRYHFSKVFEIRISFIGHNRNMTHESYLKKPKWMCEKKLNEILVKNPKLITCLNRNTSNPLIRKYSHFP